MTDDSGSPLFDLFPDPVVAYRIEDGTPVVGAVNDAFAAAFDVQKTDVLDDALSDYLFESRTAHSARTETNGEETVTDDLFGRLEAGREAVVETAREDDERRYFLLRCVPASGREADGYLVYSEVTAAERRAREAEARAERLERLASVTAHDLRNPLEVAKIRLEAARDTGDAVHFEKVEGALDRIQQIVHDALSVGGGAVDPDGRVSLAELARSSWSTVDTADATLDVGTETPTVVADAERLRQLLENLFRNAVEHGGHDVTVTVGAVEGGFSVADDGSGIPPAERESVLEPGYSSVEENTGLGLAIVEQIAVGHGWRVSVESTAAGGARFVFGGVDIVDTAEP